MPALPLLLSYYFHILMPPLPAAAALMLRFIIAMLFHVYADIFATDAAAAYDAAYAMIRHDSCRYI